MNKKVWKYDNSDDINKMVRVWVEYLRDNCYGIDKVFNRDGIFLFCEQIKSIDNL